MHFGHWQNLNSFMLEGLYLFGIEVLLFVKKSHKFLREISSFTELLSAVESSSSRNFDLELGEEFTSLFTLILRGV